MHNQNIHNPKIKHRGRAVQGTEGAPATPNFKILVKIVRDMIWARDSPIVHSAFFPATDIWLVFWSPGPMNHQGIPNKHSFQFS